MRRPATLLTSLFALLAAVALVPGTGAADPAFAATKEYVLGDPAGALDVVVCDPASDVQVGGACFDVRGVHGCLASRAEDVVAGVRTHNDLAFFRADGSATYGDPYACPLAAPQIPSDAAFVFAAPIASPTHVAPIGGTMTVYVMQGA